MSKKRAASKAKPEGMSKTWRAVMLIGGVVGGTLLLMTGILLPWIIPAVRHEIFRGSTWKYLKPPGGTGKTKGIYTTGKLIVIDRKARTLDNVHSRLPAELRAYSESEVGTVVWLEWDFEAVESRNFGGGTTGHYSTCKVTVIDTTRDVMVGEYTVMGATSRVSTGGGGRFRAPPGTMTATRCIPEVVGYLKSLPRR